MFVRNKSSYQPILARGHLTDDSALGSINLEVVYSIEATGLMPVEEPALRGPTDPPAITRYTLWREASITATGTVLGPSSAPHVRTVSLTVGTATHRLVVFGERRWTRTLMGDLEASAPEPFEAVPLVWERAFGGSYDLPPGIFPGTDLPHPGCRVTYPLNDRGIGLYPDQRAATNQLLPSIERPDQLLKRWNDTPEPGGFAPCPELVALRLPRSRADTETPEKAALAVRLHGEATAVRERLPVTMLRLLHSAPGDLILPSIDPGTKIALEGLGRAPIRFEMPRPPVRVTTHTYRSDEDVPGLVRSVHIDADAGRVRIVYGYMFPYAPARAPEWIRVAS